MKNNFFGAPVKPNTTYSYTGFGQPYFKDKDGNVLEAEIIKTTSSGNSFIIPDGAYALGFRPWGTIK